MEQNTKSDRFVVFLEDVYMRYADNTVTLEIRGNHSLWPGGVAGQDQMGHVKSIYFERELLCVRN